MFKTEHPLEISEIIVAGVHFITDLGIFKWTKDEYFRKVKVAEELIEKALCIKKGSVSFLSELLGNIPKMVYKNKIDRHYIAVALFFALSELFHPITQDSILREMQSAKNNEVKWIISHILALIAIIFLPFLAQKLMCYIDDKKVKSSILGLVISYIGVIGVVGLLIYDFILWDAWRVGNDKLIASF